MKIALITPLLQPYRISFYEKLSKTFTDITIYHNVKIIEDGRPGYNKKVNFRTKGFLEKRYIIFTFGILWLKGMLSEIMHDKPDVIITQGIPGNLTYRLIVNWAKRKGIKIVFWYCGWEPNIKRNKLLLKLKQFLALRYYRKGDYFITYGSKAKNELLNLGIPENNITIAYNGIELDEYSDIEIFRNQAVRLREEHCTEDTTVYLYVGGLLEEKRILFLIDAFNLFSAKHSNISLWIVGDGPQRQLVESKINNNYNIKYFGRVIEGVEPYFIASDFYVLPGAGGLGLNQAMFFESICICGRADGTEDDLVINEKTGLRFEDDNMESLISILNKSVSIDPELKEKMKSLSKEIILSRSNVNYMVKVFVKLLSDLYKNF